MQQTRIRIPSEQLKLFSCPACKHKQESTNLECEACGIIFSKHMNYMPLKTQLNRFLSPGEINEIRSTQERLVRVKHDVESKVELIVHCQKEKLLDLAAYHLKQEGDKTGLSVIKRLISGTYNEQEEKSYFQSFLNFLIEPAVLISGALLILLIALTAMMRNYI